MKRARSFISIFCCSARLVHSRIFCAFSCDIIFSGAVAFIGPGCADTACANIATPKDNAKRNAIGRCRCIYVTQRPVLTKIIAEEPRVQRDCVMPIMSALGHKRTYAAQQPMSALLVPGASDNPQKRSDFALPPIRPLHCAPAGPQRAVTRSLSTSTERLSSVSPLPVILAGLVMSTLGHKRTNYRGPCDV